MKLEGPNDLARPFANYTQGYLFWGLAASISPTQGLMVIATDSGLPHHLEASAQGYAIAGSRVFQTVSDNTPCHTRIKLDNKLAYHASTSITVDQKAIAAQITQTTKENDELDQLTMAFYKLVTEQIKTQEDNKTQDTEGKRIIPDGMTAFLTEKEQEIRSHKASQGLFNLLSKISTTPSSDGFGTICVDADRLPNQASFTLNGHNFKTASLILQAISGTTSLPNKETLLNELTNSFTSIGFDGVAARLKAISNPGQQALLTQAIIEAVDTVIKKNKLSKGANLIKTESQVDGSFPFEPIETPPTLTQAISYATAADKAIYFKERFIDPTERLHLIAMCEQYAEANPEKANDFTQIKGTLNNSLVGKTTLGKTPALNKESRDAVEAACNQFDKLEEIILAKQNLKEQLPETLQSLNYHLTLEQLRVDLSKLEKATPEGNTDNQDRLKSEIKAIKDGVTSLQEAIREEGKPISSQNRSLIKDFRRTVAELEHKHASITERVVLLQNVIHSCKKALAALPEDTKRYVLVEKNHETAVIDILDEINTLVHEATAITTGKIEELTEKIDQQNESFQAQVERVQALRTIENEGYESFGELRGQSKAEQIIKERTQVVLASITTALNDQDPLSLDANAVAKDLAHLQEEYDAVAAKADTLRDIVRHCDETISQTKGSTLRSESELRSLYINLKNAANEILKNSDSITKEQITEISAQFNQTERNKEFIADLIRTYNEHIRKLKVFGEGSKADSSIEQSRTELSEAAHLMRNALEAGLEKALAKQTTEQDNITGAATGFYKEIESRQQKRALFAALSGVSIGLGGSAAALAAVFLPTLLAANLAVMGFGIAACIAVLAIGACVLLAIKAHQKRPRYNVKGLKAMSKQAFKANDDKTNKKINKIIETAKKEKREENSTPTTPNGSPKAKDAKNGRPGSLSINSDDSASGYTQGRATESDTDEEQFSAGRHI